MQLLHTCARSLETAVGRVIKDCAFDLRLERRLKNAPKNRENYETGDSAENAFGQFVRIIGSWLELTSECHKIKPTSNKVESWIANFKGKMNPWAHAIDRLLRARDRLLPFQQGRDSFTPQHKGTRDVYDTARRVSDVYKMYCDSMNRLVKHAMTTVSPCAMYISHVSFALLTARYSQWRARSIGCRREHLEQYSRNNCHGCPRI